MSLVTRWQPFNELQTLQQQMDRLLAEFWKGGEWPSSNGDLLSQTPALPEIDLSEDAGRYVVKAQVPGLKAEEIDISLTDNVLSIAGESHADQRFERDQYVVRERRYGKFLRQLPLPAGADDERISASLHDGVLTIRLPKSVRTNGRTRHIRLEQGEKRGVLKVIDRLKRVLPLPGRKT